MTCPVIFGPSSFWYCVSWCANSSGLAASAPSGAAESGAMDADSAAEEGAAGAVDSLGPSGKLLLAASAFSGLVALDTSLAGVPVSYTHLRAHET